jgi:phosphoribosyl-ATP pyrophosphohydrolase
MLYDLFAIIKDRQAHPTDGSYTAQLFATGQDAILKKVGEEAMEVILAAKGQGNQRVVEEVADLFYHTLVLLADCGLGLDDVEAELRNRHTGRNSRSPN